MAYSLVPGRIQRYLPAWLDLEILRWNVTPAIGVLSERLNCGHRLQAIVDAYRDDVGNPQYAFKVCGNIHFICIFIWWKNPIFLWL